MKKPTTTIEVYRDALNEFRWRILRYGKIVADGAEGYKHQATLRRSFNRMVSSFLVQDYAFVPATKKANKK